MIRPRDPPPPPPSSTQKHFEKTPERPPRLAGRKSASYSNEDRSKKVDRNYEDFCFTSPNVTVNNHNHVDEMVELKVSNARNVTPVIDENNEQRKRIQANIEAFQGSRIFGSVNKKTVVKVAPLIIHRESVHRLEIKNDEDSQNESKKTSILINGDDCYSTINVNDDTPLYQSSVVVHDFCTSPAIIKSSSNTVSINVTTPQTPEEQLTYHHNQINSLLSRNCAKSIIPINDSLNGSMTQRIVTNPNQTRTLITLDYSDSNVSLGDGTDPKSDSELVLLLRNPVEAVKRNLVPHVCGKIVDNEPMEGHTEKQSKSGRLAEKLLQADNTSFISKLLEDPILFQLKKGIDYELMAKLIENGLVRLKESRNSLDMSGTKDEKDMNKLIETSLQKVKEERQQLEVHKSDVEKTTDDDTKSNRDSMSSGNSFSSANYEPYDFDGNDLSDCYQSCSSELTADEDGNMTRSKFYQMLVDATLSEIEITTNIEDDHHYESIRLNGDPIYEEISDIPPPLPLCPPPSDDVELEKKNSKSMFEGASKYDILSYLVDAKERGIVPEDSYTYNFGNNADVIIEEENDKSSGRLHNRQSSDISCRISHISSNSDVSDEATLKQSAVQRKSSTDIERNDSGVGSETSKTSRSKYQSLPGSILNKNSPIHLCEDCDGPVETQVTDSGVMFAPLVCRKCGKKRAERKEIVTEIVETEEKYSRDLQIILEEFYQPMLVSISAPTLY